jgi:hypothetical protein
MSVLAQAIERKQWELAALYLALGVSEAAAKLPPDAIHGLLEVLEGMPASEANAPPRKGAAHRGQRR